jgi:hypothetical protein
MLSIYDDATNVHKVRVVVAEYKARTFRRRVLRSSLKSGCRQPPTTSVHEFAIDGRGFFPAEFEDDNTVVESDRLLRLSLGNAQRALEFVFTCQIMTVLSSEMRLWPVTWGDTLRRCLGAALQEI